MGQRLQLKTLYAKKDKQHQHANQIKSNKSNQSLLSQIEKSEWRRGLGGVVRAACWCAYDHGFEQSVVSIL
jgi:hypothetical protein